MASTMRNTKVNGKSNPEIPEAICQALNLSDEKRCQEKATSLNGLFCYFHSQQCHGLYKGYKARNTRLDALNDSPPEYLATTSTPLANQEFSDVESEEVLREVYSHLSLKHALLDRVIRARKLHHSRFFPLKLDYGHQHYLDSLSNQKFIVLRALERLERRTAEVLYKQKKWFNWVRQCQDDEEAQRDKESKMIKREATLLKRHWKEIELRMRELRTKEYVQLQEEFLETAYKTRTSEPKDEEVFNWDPVDDAVENERGNFIELIRHFLWQEKSALDLDRDVQGTTPNSPPFDKNSGALHSAESSQAAELPREEITVKDDGLRQTVKKSETAKASKSSKKKRPAPDSNQNSTDKATSETKTQMRQRLRQGSNFIHSHDASQAFLEGTIESPIKQARTASLLDDEIDRLLEEVAEIKELLFSRLLLSHAALLPAALRANSIDEFLNCGDVSLADLRDLCLKMEQPGLEEIRNACADLARNGEEFEESDSENDDEDAVTAPKAKKRKYEFRKCRDILPESWVSKYEKSYRKKQVVPENLREQILGGGEAIDFGVIKDSKYKPRRIRVEICGKLIYNYPSEKAMTRGGWLHFCIIAKDSNLYDAIHLCRNWDEFFELNVLALFGYFPAANWVSWIGDRMRQQMLQLGFIPYYEFNEAQEATIHHQSARNEGRRTHAIYEARNVICANIKRNDPASRRFIQYLAMQTTFLCLLVRDAKTSRIIVQPPENELWLRREKFGLGRAVKKDWNVIQKIGPEFFKEVDSQRKWHFGFPDYYDVYLWDLKPGTPYGRLHSMVQEMLTKANRFVAAPDLYNLAAPVIKTLMRDRQSYRIREIRIGEDVPSIYDDIHNEETSFVFARLGKPASTEPPKRFFYGEADTLEDSVLFPDEQQGDPSKATVTNSLQKFEQGPPSLHRFVHDLDTDEDSDVDSDDLYKSTEGEEDSDLNKLKEDTSEYTSEDVTDDADSMEDDLYFSQDDEEGTDEESGIFAKAFQTDEEKKIYSIAKEWQRKASRAPSQPLDMKEEWDEFLDREKAKIFKDVWHKADLEHGAEEKYIEVNDMIRKMTDHGKASSRKLMEFQILVWLGEHPRAHRHVIRDIERANAMIGLFYPTEFYQSDGIEFKDTFLIQQHKRSKCIPDRRTHSSAKYQPKSYWQEWDKADKDNANDPFLIKSDIITRPIIARLFKEGIICNAYFRGANGQAIAVNEPDRSPDLFIDYRSTLHEYNMPSTLQDPIISNSSLRAAARLHAQINPSARFAVLRLWSAPHFYPLMIGWDQRHLHSFFDGYGRSWEWKFIPKDMPCSEWSMHQQGRLRLQPYAHLWAKQVVQKRDLFIVMGADADELRKLTTAVTYVLQTRPWRLEVDLWRSFVNVDFEFLEGLDDKWLD